VGCPSPPEIVEVRVIPRAVCPGETVLVEVIAKDYEASRLTADPTPVAGPASRDVGGAEVLTATSQEYQICESTSFLFKAWKGDEIDCGVRGLVSCRTGLASVVLGSEIQTFTFDGCADPGFPGRADFEIPDRDYTGSLVIESVVNCGSRNLIVGRSDGSPPQTAPPGGALPGFVGQPWIGSWSATETVWPGESCAPGPISRTGEPVPPPPPRPPEICLAFTVGCPDSDACAP
jgi:hypothetical protein